MCTVGASSLRRSFWRASAAASPEPAAPPSAGAAAAAGANLHLAACASVSCQCRNHARAMRESRHLHRRGDPSALASRRDMRDVGLRDVNQPLRVEYLRSRHMRNTRPGKGRSPRTGLETLQQHKASVNPRSNVRSAAWGSELLHEGTQRTGSRHGVRRGHKRARKRGSRWVLRSSTPRACGYIRSHDTLTRMPRDPGGRSMRGLARGRPKPRGLPPRWRKWPPGTPHGPRSSEAGRRPGGASERHPPA